MKKPLEDVRVIEAGIYVFAPYCTMMLADLGAEVIKVEPPWGDAYRGQQLEVGPKVGSSPHFFFHNMGKKGLALNLKSEKGVEIFKGLAKISDVVVENYSPGSMDRLGLGYEAIKEVNPDIIYATLSGFGRVDSPWASRGSFAIIAEAVSSHARQQGDAVDPEGPPIVTPTWIGDTGPGLFAALSIIAALLFREKTGKGQMIDVAQADCMLSLSGGDVTTYLLTGLTSAEMRQRYMSRMRSMLIRTRLPEILGVKALDHEALKKWVESKTLDEVVNKLAEIDLPDTRRYGAYGALKASDGYVMVAAGGLATMGRLAKMLGVNITDQEALIKWIESKTVDEVVNKLGEADVPVAPVLSVDQAINHPHFVDRNMVIEVEHEKAGKVKVVNFPVRFSESPGETPGPAPMLGQHNEEVLKLLGYGDEEIAKLKKEGVLGQPLG